ncbi:MAG: hypothetical protein K0B87_01560 [Candidatus Syntrophosphaera sp.]|nr:hypothetical protein [Candidatus Syntrophosphaera sp.]
MNRPKVILYVCASVDGRITFGPNTTMFDIYKQPELYQMLMNEEEWNSFSKAVFALHKPDMYLEGSNMLVAECEELKELPKYGGGINGLYEDFFPLTL